MKELKEFYSVNGVVVNLDCELNFGVNKKRVGSKSWMRYGSYEGVKNVREFFECGGLVEDLRWDYEKGFCKFLSIYDVKSKKIVKVEEKGGLE